MSDVNLRPSWYWAKLACWSHLHLEDHADDLASLLRTLDWTDCHVVGVSMGGMVTQVMAGRHTDLVKSACLVATSFGGLRMGAAIAPNTSLRGLLVGPRARLAQL